MTLEESVVNVVEFPDAKRRVKNVLGSNGCPECGKHLGGQIQFCPKCLADDWDEALMFQKAAFDTQPEVSLRNEEMTQVKKDLKRFLFEYVGWTKLTTLLAFLVSIVWIIRLFPINMSVKYFGLEMSYGFGICMFCLLYIGFFSALTYYDVGLRRDKWYRSYYHSEFNRALSGALLGISMGLFCKGLKTLTKQLDQAKTYRSTIYVPQGTKTWTSAKDWGEWSTLNNRDQLVLPSANGAGGMIISPGGKMEEYADWIQYSDLTPSMIPLMGNNYFIDPAGPQDGVKNGVEGPHDYIVSWKEVNNLNSIENKSSHLRLSIKVPKNAKEGVHILYISSNGEMINNHFLYDCYGLTFNVTTFKRVGATHITYDAQSDGSSSKYNWTSLRKSDKVSAGQSIQYFVLATTNQPVKDKSEDFNPKDLIKSGWHQLTWSGNVSDLRKIKSIQGKRYLQIAIVMSTDDVTKSPAVNSLIVNYN